MVQQEPILPKNTRETASLEAQGLLSIIAPRLDKADIKFNVLSRLVILQTKQQTLKVDIPWEQEVLLISRQGSNSLIKVPNSEGLRKPAKQTLLIMASLKSTVIVALAVLCAHADIPDYPAPAFIDPSDPTINVGMTGGNCRHCE